ncbi:YfbU family protein [Neobacillus drentensis]|uniref:YfbU family protein n=1 Tax=Neobacillus drentensis TaxID=220684 RepID=UPI002FFE4DA8
MKLTKLERLNLINQYLILEKLYPEEQETYSTLRTALEKGFEYHYEEAIEWIHDDFPEHNSEFVIDVLDMYSVILLSYSNLEDKGELIDSKVNFPGFDGNNETAFLGYARYFIRDLGRFDELKENATFRDFNSHRPMVPKYRRMVSAWKSTNDQYNLTIDDISTILNA